MSNKRPYECTEIGCGYAATQKGSLKAHMRRHFGEKPFKCKEPGCEYASVEKGHLVVHQRSHTGERPYKCDREGCGYAAKTTGQLSTHKRFHDQDRRYNCDFPGCDYSAVVPCSLEVHKRKHSNERPFPCHVEDCDYAAKQRTDLDRHKLTHSGERLFTCQVDGCGAAFKLAHHYETHQRVHDGRKPYPCLVAGCDYAATTSGSLTCHIRTHTGERPYVCEHPQCDYTANRAHHLEKHTEAMHTKEGIQRRKKKEEALGKALTQAGISFKREHHISFQCFGGTWAFCDFVVMMQDRVVVIECDEYQHTFSNYSVSCEVRRMMDIVNSLRVGGCTLPISIIRWNPDSFTVDGVKKKVAVKDKQRRLIDVVESFEGTARPDFEILYMFYDVQDNKPTLWTDSEYDQTVLTFCTDVIV